MTIEVWHWSTKRIEGEKKCGICNEIYILNWVWTHKVSGTTLSTTTADCRLRRWWWCVVDGYIYTPWPKLSKWCVNIMRQPKVVSQGKPSTPHCLCSSYRIKRIANNKATFNTLQRWSTLSKQDACVCCLTSFSFHLLSVVPFFLRTLRKM